MHKKTMQILSLSVASLFVASTAMAFHGTGAISGDVNQIDIEQVGSTNTSTSTQQGVNNVMDLFQGDNGLNDIKAHQDGNLNKANINQLNTANPSGGTFDNSIVLIQEGGNGNEASVDQDTDGNTTKGRNTVDINQNGNNNKVRGANENTTTDVAEQDTSAYPGSKATQIATVGDNSLTVDQDGDANQAGLYQSGTLGNTANIVQEGGDLLASYQKSTGAFGNDLDVDQLGTGINSAENLQTGASSHTFTLCQTDGSIGNICP